MTRAFNETSFFEAYERLILDAMRGDHTLFTTADGIDGSGRSPFHCWMPRRRFANMHLGRGVPMLFISWSRRMPGAYRSSAPGAIPTRRAASEGLRPATAAHNQLLTSGVRSLLGMFSRS